MVEMPDILKWSITSKKDLNKQMKEV
jgi:hypothetical protein